MTIRVTDVPTPLRHAFRIVVNRWRRDRCPDQFETAATHDAEHGPEQLTISIRHHETFPMGGQLFTVDIRSPDPYPDNLLHRECIEYFFGDESRHDDEPQ